MYVILLQYKGESIENSVFHFYYSVVFGVLRIKIGDFEYFLPF